MSKAKNEKCSEKWFTDPNDLILRIALWEEYGYKDVYYGEFIPFRNLQVDHIIPRDVFKNEQLLSDTLKKYGLDSTFKENSLLNFLPASNRSNGRKSSKDLPAVIAFGLDLAKKHEKKIRKKIRYYHALNNTYKHALITRRYFDNLGSDALYNYIDILLDDTLPFQDNSLMYGINRYSKGTNRIQFDGRLPSNDFYEIYCDIQFQNLQTRYVSITLNAEFIYTEILPSYTCPFDSGARTYIEKHTDSEEYFLKFPSCILRINKNDLEQLCDILDGYCEEIIKRLKEFIRNNNIEKYMLKDRYFIIYELKKTTCEKLWAFIGNNKKYNGYDLSDSCPEKLKIKSSQGYHAILEYKSAPDNNWKYEETYYICEAFNYVIDTNDMNYWSLDTVKDFLMGLIGKALNDSPTINQNSIATAGNNFLKKDQIISFTSCVDCISTLQDHYKSKRRKYYLSRNIYKMLYNMVNKYSIDGSSLNKDICSILGFNMTSSKNMLLQNIKSEQDKWEPKTYDGDQISKVLEVIYCYTEKCIFGKNEIKDVIESISEVIDFYNIETLLLFFASTFCRKVQNVFVGKCNYIL